MPPDTWNNQILIVTHKPLKCPRAFSTLKGDRRCLQGECDAAVHRANGGASYFGTSQKETSGLWMAETMAAGETYHGHARNLFVAYRNNKLLE